MLTFLGIGTQKSGTTWLYSMLKHHPRVRFPNRKEVHFWNSPAPPPLNVPPEKVIAPSLKARSFPATVVPPRSSVEPL